MKKEFELDAYRKGQELYLVLSGQLVLKHCKDTKVRLNNLFTPQVDQIYLYLGNLTFLDSAGLGVLVGMKMTANKHRTRLVFLSPPSRVEDIFRVSKLDSIFEIRSGSEAEVIRGGLERDDNLMWSDREDAPSSAQLGDVQSSQGQSHSAGGSGVGQADPRETAAQGRKLCSDAVEYIRQGNYERAIEAYEQALKCDSENLSALNNLGIIYEKRPEWYSKAHQVWKAVLEVSQRHNDEKHAARAQKHLDSLSKLLSDS